MSPETKVEQQPVEELFGVVNPDAINAVLLYRPVEQPRPHNAAKGLAALGLCGALLVAALNTHEPSPSGLHQSNTASLETTTTLPPGTTTTTTEQTTTTTIPPQPAKSTPAPPSAPAPTAPPVQAVKPLDIGNDISFPNCSSAIPTTSSFGIVGVNFGSDYTANFCLSEEASKFHNPWLYVNSNYPGDTEAAAKYNATPNVCAAGDVNCLAYDYGYNAGVQDVVYTNHVKVDSAVWWVDVETTNSWQGTVAQHQQDIIGEVQGIEAEHRALYGNSVFAGFYSTTFQWNEITAGLQAGLPVWYATGLGNVPNITDYCHSSSFDGGHLAIIQYLENNLDTDFSCP